jgi:putative membrane protein
MALLQLVVGRALQRGLALKGAHRVMPDPVISYCGPAAVPDELWTRWNADPLLLATLAALALMTARAHSSNARAGWAAVALLIIVFVSPLCALSSALFSARVVHHILLIAVVAPLLALAFPLRRLGSPPLGILVAAHAVILWLWHAPGPYAWGLASVPAYWLMQVSLLGSAWLMWRAILAPTTQTGAALIALVATIAQMGLLGALITFAPGPLYLVHLASTVSWGLTPLADQQLAGLVMWLPATLPYLGLGLWLAWSGLRPGAPAL